MTATMDAPAVAHRYTVAGRVKRHPGLATALAYWRAQGIVYQDPTPEMLALQAEARRKGPCEGASFPCLCATLRLHDFGTVCAECGCDGWNVLPYLRQRGTPVMVWRDDFGSNGPDGMRYRLFTDGRDDEEIGIAPWSLGGKGA